MTQSPPLGLNVILISNSSVGKTCLHRRFLDERSSLNVTATYRVDVLYQNMQVDGRHVKLGIRDTAGMERFRSITAAYYRDVQGVILVYNITDATSFNALPGWLAEIENYIPSSVPKMIVGNKLDQEHSREVDTSEGELFASYSGALFREASAQTLVGVTEVFEDLVKEMLDAEDRRDPTDTARRGPDNELVESCANERPKRGWWGKCSC